MNDQNLARVICVATGKGGSFKTSLAANSAGLMAAGGYRTLLVDFDPQGDLADDLGYHSDDRLDDGQHLASSLIAGTPLQPVLRDVRPNLDVVPGGEYLADIGGMMLARQSRMSSNYDLLAKSLSPLAADYDLVVIDTPPVDEMLQLLALRASRWLVVPTKEDKSSIRAIARIAQRAAEVRQEGHRIDLLGVVLAGVPTAATTVRRRAARDIEGMLGEVAPLFTSVIRHSSAAAQTMREEGLLAHELADKVEGTDFFAELRKAIADGTERPTRPGSAPDLATEYVRVVEQILQRINELEVAELEQSA
ncbi:ParA family protein [Nocardioides sp. Bht2]|uniref:ParA family protein n=1 Tax=Nocardioides sp. Bht2 TaxID=3392297 RepID=UPI0039B6CD57